MGFPNTRRYFSFLFLNSFGYNIKKQHFKDIVPDFVTIGKSMGNGHPVSCLLTKTEWTEKFGRNGLQYFNTVIIS